MYIHKGLYLIFFFVLYSRPFKLIPDQYYKNENIHETNEFLAIRHPLYYFYVKYFDLFSRC